MYTHIHMYMYICIYICIYVEILAALYTDPNCVNA